MWVNTSAGMRAAFANFPRGSDRPLIWARDPLVAQLESVCAQADVTRRIPGASLPSDWGMNLNVGRDEYLVNKACGEILEVG